MVWREGRGTNEEMTEGLLLASTCETEKSASNCMKAQDSTR
jgi:hypothetical protein